MLEIRCPDYQTLSRRATDLILAELSRKPHLLLCASAGSTPTGAYAGLAARCEREPRLFAKLRVLQIDEWGLPRGSPASCEVDLRKKLLVPLRIGRDRFAGFRAEAPDPARECRRIARWLEANGPIDLCILGLGTNGHVALNEPARTLSPGAHVARLAKSSLHHGMLKALPTKPRHGLTLGLGEILQSRKLLLLVNGRHKRRSLKRLLQPQISTFFPASFLWLHPHCTVLYDNEAAGTI